MSVVFAIVFPSGNLLEEFLYLDVREISPTVSGVSSRHTVFSSATKPTVPITRPAISAIRFQRLLRVVNTENLLRRDCGV